MTQTLGARLMFLALVPTLSVLAIGGAALQSSRAQARGTADLAEHVDDLATMMRISISIDDEEFATLTQTQAALFGLTSESVASLLGFDLAEARTTARRSVDMLVGTLPSHIDLTEAVDALSVARRGFDDSTLSADEVSAGYRRAQAVVTSSLERELAHASSLLAAARASDRLMAGYSDLQTLYEVVQHVDRQVPLVFSRLVATMGLQLSANAESGLDEVMGWYSVVARQLDSSLDGDVGARWASVRSDEHVVAFESRVTALLRDGAELDGDNIADLASVATDGFAREQAFVAVFGLAADNTSELAADAASDARAGAEQTLWMLVGILVVTVGLVVLVALSITRPLGRLAAAARDVSDGDLAARRRAGTGGPVEVAVVREAFLDLVENVALFDAQADALAHNRLDDPVLDEPVPGRLGASVQLSVAQLSRTMTERDRLHDRLRYEATHDNLTGLANRAVVHVTLESAVARVRRSGIPAALLFVDLDDFKRINDIHGHAAGDTVLAAVATRLHDSVRSGGLVARLGGDEFLVLADECPPGTAVELAHRLLRSIEPPIDLGDGASAKIGACVGITVLDGLTDNPDELLREADVAAYRAKSAGRGVVELFDDDLRLELQRISQIERDVAEAIVESSLHHVFQPIWNTRSRQVVGFEALARWTRADGSMVAPDEFIPVAERSDLIREIDNHVMRGALADARAWPTAIRVSVNISGRHLLDPRVVDDVASALHQTGFDAHRLVIEITETVLVADTDLATEHLMALRSLGASVSIDDFGSGYTSFAHLRLLPVDVLKIDKFFIDELLLDGDARLVRVVTEAAHGLGMTVVAEGVETDSQMSILEALDCDEVQGFLLGRPMSPQQASALVDANAVPADAR